MKRFAKFTGGCYWLSLSARRCGYEHPHRMETLASRPTIQFAGPRRLEGNPMAPCYQGSTYRQPSTSSAPSLKAGLFRCRAAGTFSFCG